MSKYAYDSRNYNGIDLVNFICSYLVLIIHIAPFSNEYMPCGDWLQIIITQYICRLAVPFFFCASGFLLFRKTDLTKIDAKRIKLYIFRILRLYGLWTLLLFLGSSGQLWYLGATVIAVLIIFFLLKLKIPIKVLVLIAFVFFCIGTLISSYNQLLLQKNIYAINVILMTTEKLPVEISGAFNSGLLYILIGGLFANNHFRFSRKASLVGLLLSSVLLLFEVLFITWYLGTKESTMFFFHLPTVLFLFSFTKSMRLNPNPIYKRLRIVGVLVFFLHNFINEICWLVGGIISRIIPVNALCVFVASVILVTITCFFIEKLSRRSNLTWLKYLYS